MFDVSNLWVKITYHAGILHTHLGLIIDKPSTMDHGDNVHPNPQRHAIGVAALELFSQFQVAELLRNASGY